MNKKLTERLVRDFGAENIKENFAETTLIAEAKNIVKTCKRLRDDYDFDLLVDLLGVDYLSYGRSEWRADASADGFSRARENLSDRDEHPEYPERFAVVYHLLSVEKNLRLRVKIFVPEAEPIVDSVTEIWPSANWSEREVFDLFGILFENHTDLRRILTDYGFIGHPLRKDFPLIGKVEVRYDETQGRVIYEPVSIEENVSVPKIIRKK